MREMKALIRKDLPSSSDDDAESVASVSTTRSRAVTQQDKSARLAKNLRALGADDAEELRIQPMTPEELFKMRVEIMPQLQ